MQGVGWRRQVKQHAGGRLEEAGEAMGSQRRTLRGQAVYAV